MARTTYTHSLGSKTYFVEYNYQQSKPTNVTRPSIKIGNQEQFMAVANRVFRHLPPKTIVSRIIAARQSTPADKCLPYIKPTLTPMDNRPPLTIVPWTNPLDNI